MYGLDKGVNLDFLIGKTFIQIQAGLSNLAFCFTDDISISSESIVNIVTENISQVIDLGDEYYLSIIAPLALFFDKEVCSYSIDDDGSLTLRFADFDGSLEFIDGNSYFESYQICNKTEIVVV